MRNCFAFTFSTYQEKRPKIKPNKKYIIKIKNLCFNFNSPKAENVSDNIILILFIMIKIKSKSDFFLLIVIVGHLVNIFN